MFLAIFPIIGYLVGSVSSAVIISRLFGHPDPRLSGSGNAGATNVLRMSGELAGGLTLLSDVLKGTIPVLVANLVAGDPLVTAATTLAAVLGHIYPIFFGFKGGKGVATSFGAYLGISIFLPFGIGICWLVVAFITRYASASSLAAMACAPLFAWKLGLDTPVVSATAILFVLIAVSHRDNIKRLFAGEERKLGDRPKWDKLP